MTTHPAQLPPPDPARKSALALRDTYMLQPGGMRGGADELSDDGFDLKDLLRVLLKHKWALLSTALIGLAVATVDGLTRTPMYRTAAVTSAPIASSTSSAASGALKRPSSVSNTIPTALLGSHC